MRAIILALAACLALVPAAARAELDAKGVRLGVNLFDLQPPPQTGTILKPGPTIGAFVTWRLARVFALQGELLITDKRVATEECMQGCMETGGIDLWFLELPFLARVDVLPGERAKLHFDLGPELVLPFGGVVTRDPTETPIDDLNPINLGVVIGAGLEIGAGPGRLTFDVRYKRWALAVAADPDSDGSDDMISTHQLVVLGGYAFP